MTRPRPFLSVILPAYNAEPTLQASIFSILDQSFGDFELLILNDGSTDGTAEIARKLARHDPRIKYFEHENMGLVRTLNFGLRTAAAPIVARMDADDVALSHRFNAQVEFLERHSDVVLVGSGILECANDLTPIREIRLPTDPDHVRRHLLQLGNAFAHPTVMFRKQPVLEYGGYNPFFEHAEDYALWIDLATRYELANLEDVLLKYRKNAGSVSSKYLFRQVVSELCARLAVSRGRSLTEFGEPHRADLATVESLGGSIEDVRSLYRARGGSEEDWTADLRQAREIRNERVAPGVPHLLSARREMQFQVSVVVPTYNHARYVPDAIESALLCRPVREVLVADDGSTDDTRAAIKRAVNKDDRVRDLTESPPVNKGAHNRLNILIEAAKYPIIAVLNSDDLFCISRFDGLEDLFATGCDLAFGDLLIIDETNRPLWTKRGPYTTNYPFPPGVDVGEMVRTGKVLQLLCHQNFSGTTSNFVFRRDLWSRLDGFRDYRYVHDWDFLLRACALGRVAYLSKFFTSYRIHGSNTIQESESKVAAESEKMLMRIESELGSMIDPVGKSMMTTTLRKLRGSLQA